MKFLNSSENLARLRGVECFVLDMDGTFYLGNRLLEGSLDFLHEMRAAGKRVLFLTNNSSHDGRYYVEKLARMGCDTEPSDIYTSGMAACQYLNRVFPGKKVFVMGNEFLRRECVSYGITIEEDEPDLVLAGYDTTLDYAKLVKVCDFIRAGLPYIATHPDFNCPVEKGFEPDLGSFMALIEASTGRKADIIIGKPYGEIVRGLLEMTGLAPEKLCICGDRLYTDIATGARNGILSVCVLTGETTPAVLEVSEVQPDLVFDRLYDMVPVVLE